MNKQVVVAMTLSLVVILAIVTVTAEDSEAEDVGDYKYTLWTKTATLQGFSGEPVAEVVIPETITVGDKTYTVNKIGVRAFVNQTTIKSVTIQSSDIELESQAFAGCTGLTSFTANSLTEYTNSTFEGCTALKTFIVNGDLTLRYGTFKNCTALETFKVDGTDYSIENNLIINPNGTVIAYTCGDNANVVIPDSVTAIGKNVFWNSSIASVTFGANVESVGDNAFCQCHDLTVVELNDKLESIGDYAFESTALTEIDLPESLTSLGGNAFRSCSSLETIDVPESVETVGAYTFSGCSALKTVTGMEGVTTIGQDAFSNSDIETITFSSKLTSIGQSAFAYCDSLESVDIPTTDGTLNIANRAFADCDNLNEFTAGGDVSFNNKVFENNSNLSTVNTPNVKSLGSNTFDGCTALTEVTLGADCDIPETAFKDCSKLNSVTIGGETFPVTSDGSVGTYAFKVGDYRYATLKEAVDSIQSKGSVTAIDDFTMFTDEIVTIPKEKEIKLDMNGVTATAASDFNGRYIINYGTLTITGDGTFEDADSPNYKGPVTNNGTLTIENGTFHGNTKNTAAHIWNATGATATFNGGTYEGAVTIINAYYGSKTYINGGTYINSWYPTIDNSGHMEIRGGEFVNRSCSSCNEPSYEDDRPWGYTIRSGHYISDNVADEYEAYLLIEEADGNDISVTGVQGAITIVDGSAEINSGSFKTVSCTNTEHSDGRTSYYALYVAPENYHEVKVTVNGGDFESAFRSVAKIGFDNDIKTEVDAIVDINGGNFIAPSSISTVSQNAEGGGDVTISGGTFQNRLSADTTSPDTSISSYIAEDCIMGDDGSIATKVTVSFDMPGDVQDISVSIVKGATVPSDEIPKASDGYTYTYTAGGFPWDQTAPVNADISVTVTNSLNPPTVACDVDYDDKLGATITIEASHPVTSLDFSYSATSPAGESMSVSENGVYTELPGTHKITVTVTDNDGLSATVTTEVLVSFEDQSTAGATVVDVMPGETSAEVSAGGLVFGFEDLQHGNLRVSVQVTESEDVPGYGTSAGSYEIIVAGSAWTEGKTITISIPVNVPNGQCIVSDSVAVFFIPVDSDPEDMNAVVGDDGSSIVFNTTHNSEYAVFYDLEVIPEDDPSFNPYPGDDDDYVPIPPTIVYEDDGSDSTASIAACAAAAVVAAILAIVLASTYRRK